MPELPEVEILKRELEAQVVGRRVAEVTSQGDFSTKGLVGARIVGVERRGKMLLLDLDSGLSLVIHLMMVGQLLLSPPFQGQPRDVRLTLCFDDGGQLTLGQVDLKFVHLLPTEEVERLPAIRKLGLDPLGETFTVQRLSGMLAGRRGMIKPFLLNQAHIAGLGNSYADEILFRARIAPTRRCSSLAPEEVARLHASIVDTLRQGIEWGGASEMAFVHLDGTEGRFQERFQVKGRKGHPCLVCGTPIERITVGGRGTHFCSRCQS